MATNDPKQRTVGDDALLARVDERTNALTTALRDLQGLHQTGTKEVTQAIHAVQESNKVDTKEILTAVAAHLTDDTNRFEKHDIRLKVLENWRWYVLGTIAAAGVVMWFLK